MADSRELTFGMDFGLDDAIGKLNDAIDRLERITSTAEDAEDAAQGMGARFRAGTDAIVDGARDADDALDDLGDGADDVQLSFRDMGREAESFGSAVGKSMGAAAKESNSVTKTIKAGFDGAIGYTEKKITGFTGKVKTGRVTVSIRTTQAVQINQEQAIPEAFTTVKTTVSPNKVAIKQALLDGVEVPGCHLEARESVSIR
mgnify:CR=1 FL=1